MLKFSLEDFSFPDMMALGSDLRESGHHARSMEEAGDRVVRHLYDGLQSKQTGENACALVRFFTTQCFDHLEPDLQRFACRMLGNTPAMPEMKCLVLVATAGDSPEWNSRACSKSHKAIPLPSEQAIAQSPMFSQLLRQMGINTRAVAGFEPNLMFEQDESHLNVFHVPHAGGSPYLPAQRDFVVAHGIESVLGFGGLLSTNEVFAVILFSRIFIPHHVAELFRTVGLMVRIAINPFARAPFATAAESYRQ